MAPLSRTEYAGLAAAAGYAPVGMGTTRGAALPDSVPHCTMAAAKPHQLVDPAADRW